MHLESKMQAIASVKVELEFLGLLRLQPKPPVANDRTETYRTLAHRCALFQTALQI